MNITCEHCGSSIDVDKNKVCPNCKAPYKNNKMYKEYLEHEKKERELNLESKSIDLEMKKNITQGVKTVGKVTVISFILPFVIFIVIVVIGFVMFSNVKNNHDETFDTNYDEMFDDFYNDNQIDNVVVNINETADNGRYSVTCDEYLVNELYSFSDRKETPDDGYKYVTIHLILNNYNDYDIYFTEDINLTVDGLAQKSITDFKRDEIPMHVSGNLKVEGYYTFQVKEDVKEYDIKVGNNITINIVEGN